MKIRFTNIIIYNSLGAWITYGGQNDVEDAYQCMTAAYDAGVNFFDNAEGYAAGNAEIVMGEVIKKAGWRRSDLVISTKIFFGARKTPGVNDRGLSRKHIIEGMNESLKRLQLDYVDIVFCHRPGKCYSLSNLNSTQHHKPHESPFEKHAS